MNDTIEHSGIIQSMKNGYARVLITQVSACAGCHARSACMASDRKEKVIDVPCHDTRFKPGDRVTIAGSSSIGRKAVLFAFILPFIVLFSVLLIVYAVTHDELRAGLISLLTLIPYYLILYLLRNTMKKQFTFYIKEE